MPRREFSKKRLYSRHTFPFWYIGWKPGRKFHSRIRMDDNTVCNRDTIPRTNGNSCISFLFKTNPTVYVLLMRLDLYFGPCTSVFTFNTAHLLFALFIIILFILFIIYFVACSYYHLTSLMFELVLAMTPDEPDWAF